MRLGWEAGRDQNFGGKVTVQAAGPAQVERPSHLGVTGIRIDRSLSPSPHPSHSRSPSPRASVSEISASDAFLLKRLH